MTLKDQQDPTHLGTVEKDGGPAPVTADELQRFKTELNHIAKTSGWNINQRRFAAEETRFCLWEGQSPDGRKHKEAQDGRAAFPFEGASDVRQRLADMVINERTMILTAAGISHQPNVSSLELNNAGLGHKLTTLLKWVIANKLGADYPREIVKLASYQEADSPAGAILGVWWDQQAALEMQTLTKDQIAEVLVQAFGMPADHVAALETALMDPSKDKDTAAALQQIVPHLSDARARQVVKALRDDGKAEFPSPYLRTDCPRLCAYRLYDDIFIPTNTVALRRRARCIYIREWLAEFEVKERINTYGWTESFVEEVMKHEGQTGFPQYRRNIIGEMELVTTQETIDQRRGLFEVWTVFYQAVNDDNIPGIYYFTFHHAVEKDAQNTYAAGPRQVLEYKHGEYPFTWFGREILSSRLLDSRSVAELIATDQNSLKLLEDAFNDHVSLTTVPPIKVPHGRGKLRLVIGPLKQIEERRPGEIEYMQSPTYPQGATEQQQVIKNRVNEYFGRIAENVPPMLQQLHAGHMTTLFLASLTDALTQMLQLCQQFISDEDLQMITGDDGIPIARDRSEIQGKFRVTLSFDPRNMDLEYVGKIAELIGKVILPMDTLSTVQRDQIVKWLFMAINPWLATHSLTPAATAQQSEIADEENNFTKIAAGIEPQMVESGQNFPLRLQVLMGIGQKNPEALQKLTPVSKEIYEARQKYLQNQVQQLKNAQIGRQVGQPALQTDDGGGPPAPAGISGPPPQNLGQPAPGAAPAQ